MADTKIEWATRVWNPVTGCSKVSTGCQHCYAERMANRLRGRCGYPEDDPFRVTLHPERLKEPGRWKKPQRIFVCSMGDLFHEDVPVTYMEEVLAVVTNFPQHTFMVLTKRAERLNLLTNDRLRISRTDTSPIANLWLGVTSENQEQADKRIPLLLKTPAAVRFVCVEPILGPVGMARHFPHVHGKRNDRFWVICGGETGPGARPMHLDWAKSLRDQCQAAGAPFFFKSWGEWAHLDWRHTVPRRWDAWVWPDGDLRIIDGGEHPSNIEGCFLMRKTGKKRAGRLLDGRQWNDFPQ